MLCLISVWGCYIDASALLSRPIKTCQMRVSNCGPPLTLKQLHLPSACASEANVWAMEEHIYDQVSIILSSIRYADMLLNLVFSNILNVHYKDLQSGSLVNQLHIRSAFQVDRLLKVLYISCRIYTHVHTLVKAATIFKLVFTQTHTHTLMAAGVRDRTIKPPIRGRWV